MKITAPVIFGFAIGLVMFLQYFIPHPGMQRAYNVILDWKQVVIGMTLILGVYSLVRFHATRIQRRHPSWVYSLVAMAGLAGMVAAAAIGGTERGPYNWLFEYVQAPMQSTMFALLAFFVASASYRAFRARSVHATLLLVAGVVVMLGRVPLGEYLGVTIGGRELSVPKLATFILDVPNLAAKRGILIGVGLGVTATALKILLGIERTYLGKGSR
jgi:hypothetical protein